MRAIFTLAGITILTAFLAATALAESPTADLHTYRADIGGGTLLLTFNDNLSGIVYARINGAAFPADGPGPDACGGMASGFDSFDPPVGTSGGGFALRILFVNSNVDVSAVFINGTISNGGQIEATAYYGQVTLGPICESARLTASFSGPVDMPPGPNDQIYTGDVTGGGTIALGLTAGRQGITFLRLAGVQLVDCQYPSFNALAFFDPPIAAPASINEGVAPEALHVWQSFSEGIGVAVSARPGSDASLDGELFFHRFTPGSCHETLSWHAPQFAEATPTATPSAQLSLPGTGARGSSSTGLWSIVMLLSLGAGALALGNIHRLLRRSPSPR